MKILFPVLFWNCISDTFNEELLLDCYDIQFNIVLLQSPNYVLNLLVYPDLYNYFLHLSFVLNYNPNQGSHAGYMYIPTMKKRTKQPKMKNLWKPRNISALLYV